MRDCAFGACVRHHSARNGCQSARDQPRDGSRVHIFEHISSLPRLTVGMLHASLAMRRFRHAATKLLSLLMTLLQKRFQNIG